jgi:hypothetical protein
MKRVLGVALILAGVGAVWLASRMRTDPLPLLPPPATVHHHLEFRLEVREESGQYVFRVAGATDAPPGTVLRARVFAVEAMGDFRLGVREDEEPLVYEDEGPVPAWRRFRPEDGAFSVDVYAFRRRPYSLRYRARVAYHPEDQTREIRDRLGEESVSAAADLRLGTDVALAQEIQSRQAEAQADLAELEEIWAQIRRPPPACSDAESGYAWSRIWMTTIEASERRNLERFGLWCVAIERVSKMRLSGVAECLRRIIDDRTAVLAGDSDRAERLRDRMTALAEYLEETREASGLDTLDPDLFRPLLTRYEAAVAGLPATRREALEALLRCAPPLTRRRRAYALLSDIGDRLARLLEAPGPQTREAHDLTLAAFKSLAGLD